MLRASCRAPYNWCAFDGPRLDETGLQGLGCSDQARAIDAYITHERVILSLQQILGTINSQLFPSLPHPLPRWAPSLSQKCSQVAQETRLPVQLWLISWQITRSRLRSPASSCIHTPRLRGWHRVSTPGLGLVDARSRDRDRM